MGGLSTSAVMGANRLQHVSFQRERSVSGSGFRSRSSMPSLHLCCVCVYIYIHIHNHVYIYMPVPILCLPYWSAGVENPGCTTVVQPLPGAGGGVCSAVGASLGFGVRNERWDPSSALVHLRLRSPELSFLLCKVEGRGPAFRAAGMK